MKFNIKFGSQKGSAPGMKQVANMMGRAWQKTHTALFFIFLFTLVSIGAYIWRKSLYQGEWSDERKQEYLNSQDKGVVFKESDFEKVISDVQARKKENSDGDQSVKDIFQPYK